MTEVHTLSTASASASMLLKKHVGVHVVVPLSATATLIFKHLLSSIVFPPQLCCSCESQRGKIESKVVRSDVPLSERTS